MMVFGLSGGTAIARDIDVFLIIGQSNARANSESAATAPDASKIALKYESGILSPAIEPIGPGDHGSAWSAFAVTYHKITGRMVAIVNAAVGSSSMLPQTDTGNGNWSSEGKLYSASLAQFHEAISALKGAGYTIGKQFVIDIQGETEADALNRRKPTIKSYQFRSAKQAMIAGYRTDLGPTIRFYFSRLGGPSTGMTAGYRKIQRMQEQIVQYDHLSKIMFWGAESFIRRGMMQRGPNTLHYTQAGYNEMGRVGAANIASGNFGRASRLAAGPAKRSFLCSRFSRNFVSNGDN